METAISREDISTALSIGRRLGLRGESARTFARLSLNVRCGHCGQRCLDDRVIQKVGGTHYVFHSRCADVGALELRAEAAEARSPAAYARKRDAKERLAAARRR